MRSCGRCARRPLFLLCANLRCFRQRQPCSNVCKGSTRAIDPVQDEQPASVECGNWYRLHGFAGSDPRRDVTVGQLNKHIHRLEALIDGGSEWHETVDTVEFAVKDGPTQYCMSSRIMHRIDFGFGDLNPHIGVVPISGNPMLHPGTSCRLICFVVFQGQSRPPWCVTEYLTVHPGLVMLSPIVPSAIDHTAIGDRATRCPRNAGNREAAKPVPE
jgi:hypothetical protein